MVGREDGIGKLQVAVDSCVSVGNAVDEVSNLFLFVCREKRVLCQKPMVAIFYIFKLFRIHMGFMQLQAHFGKFLSVLFHSFGMVARGTRIGNFVQNASESDAIAAVLGHHVVTGFGRGNA